MSSVEAMIAKLSHESNENDEDPDAHATLREFVDYTEYLPSDLFRSLQLIRNLDAQEADHRGHLECLTKEFANLPARAPHASSVFTSASSASPSDPDDIPGDRTQTANGISNDSVRCGSWPISDEEMEMRLQISRSINASIRTRQESAAEATKLYQNINRHFWRISAIRSKLDEVTVPSRDPTPVSPRKPKTDKSTDENTHCRITLRLNPDRTPHTASRGRRRGGSTGTSRPRLPPITPAGNEDDWEDIPDTIQQLGKHRKKKAAGGGPKRGPKPPTDPPFSGGAPARNEDGTLIPSHLLPWNRLTNEELARLRKRMKKNSGWTPSVTMIIRELESLSRGPKHKDNFMDQREGRLGEDYLKIYGPEDGGIGDPEKIAPDDGAGVRENKGMRLNRAKKRKREEERKEKEREAEIERLEAEQEQERTRLKAEEEERREKERIERIERIAREKAENERAAREAREAAAREAAIAAAKEKAEKDRLAKAREEKAREKALKKEQERAAAVAAATSRKTRSASISTVNTTNTTATNTATTNEDEDEEMPDVDIPPPPPPPRPPRRLGRPPKNPAATTFKPGHKRVASNVPAGTSATDNKRSKRGVSAAAPPPPPPPTRRKRADSVTGLPKLGNRVTKAGAGGRKKGLIAGRRRAAAAGGSVKEEDGEGAGEGEWVDEDEEDLNRYCLCNEVSRGTMVACENPQCPKVWFHIDCIGLEEEEADSLKWYCPICKDDQAPGKRGGKRRRKV